MKKLLILLIGVMCFVIISGCRRQQEGTFILSYAGHYSTLNYLVSQSASDSDVYANLVDGLVENDQYGRIVPSLATSWSDEVVDGKHIWTFQIRQGVNWVQKKGRDITPYDTVKADDWVQAARYILNPNNASEITSLWFLFVDNPEEYYCGLDLARNPDSECALSLENEPTTDFSKVGIKATDEYELQFTLRRPAPYFLTALTYSAFYPVNGEYLRSAGDRFGFDGDNILINGGYILTQDIENARMVLEKNDYYWDHENVHIERAMFVYAPANAGFDWARLKFENNELSQFRIQELDREGWRKYITGSCTDDVCEGSMQKPVNPNVIVTESVGKFSYYSLWNFNRENFDGTKLNAAQREASKKAILNTDFRLGFFYGVKRDDFLMQYTASNPLQWARNTFTPRDLAYDQYGTDYVDYIAQVYSERKNVSLETALERLSDGVEGKLDLNRARVHFEAAKQQLISEGLTEADFPILIESVATNDANRLPFHRALADEFNTQFGDIARFELMVPSSDNEWRQWSNERMSYHFRIFMGWGPDYADPLTFANTYVINGDMLHYSGLTGQAALQQQLLGSYTEKIQQADAIWEVDRINERFRKFAEAEYHLTYETAIIIPFLSPSGSDVIVTKVKPFTAMRAPYGLSASKFKHMILLNEPITAEYRQQLEEEYEDNRPMD